MNATPSLMKRLAAPAAVLALLALAPAVSAEDFETCWGHYEAGRWKDAASCFEKVVPEFEGWAWGHHYLGVSYQQSGQSGPALEQLGKAMELMASDEDPSADPFITAAGIYEGQRKYREAMDVLARAQPFLKAEDEQDVEAMKGRLHFGEENWSGAIKHLKASRRRDFQTWYYLGVAHYRDGDLEAATDALEEAYGKDPSHGSTLEFLALAFSKRAESMRDDRTREQLWGRVADLGKDITSKQPGNPDAHNLYGRALMGAKRYEPAIGAFKKVLSLKPSHCYAKYNLAQLYLAKKDWSQAIKYGNQSLKCLKGKDEKRNAHMTVGDAQMGVGKGQVEGLSDSDVPGRTRAIGTYSSALEQFRAAKRSRGSTGLDGKIQACEATIEGLQEQLSTLDENAAIEAENQRKLKEAEERQKALDAATGKGK